MSKKKFLYIIPVSVLTVTVIVLIMINHKPAADKAALIADKDFSQNGFDLLESESLGFLRYGLNGSVITGKLGKPDKKSAESGWGADGLLHQSWYYSSAGIELDMIRDNDTQTINMITITSPCKYRTKRNIGIGSSRDDLLKAYNKEIDKKEIRNDSITTGSVYGGIVFSLKNNRVTGIFIGAQAE